MVRKSRDTVPFCIVRLTPNTLRAKVQRGIKKENTPLVQCAMCNVHPLRIEILHLAQKAEITHAKEPFRPSINCFYCGTLHSLSSSQNVQLFMPCFRPLKLFCLLFFNCDFLVTFTFIIITYITVLVFLILRLQCWYY